MYLRFLHWMAPSRGCGRRPRVYVRRDDDELQHDRNGDVRRSNFNHIVCLITSEE